jgi:hypothetical protein
VYPDDEQSLEALGRSAADLVQDGPDWVLRRKEKVTLLDETTVRRQMSVDFAVPSRAWSRPFRTGDRISYAPLFFLQKGSDEEFDPAAELTEPEPHFANFDFRDERGRALSLPPRIWNAEVSGRMLWAVISDALGRHPDLDGSDSTGIEAIARDLCRSPHLRAVKLVRLLRHGQSVDYENRQTEEENILRQLDAREPTVRRMLDVCSISSVVMIPLLGPEARNGILKLSYDEQVASVSSDRKRFHWAQAEVGWTGFELWVETPYIAASTYHFEIQAPEGLEIYDAGLVRVGLRPLHAAGRPEYDRRLDRASGFASRLHLYKPCAEEEAKALAWVRLRVRRQEFVGGAMVASGLASIVLWVAFAFADDASKSPAGVPTLLLLLPSLIAAYVVRPGPHRLTVRMLRVARWLVGAAAALPFVAAGFLALTDRDRQGHIINPQFKWWWLGLAISATLIALVLAATRLFPQPEINARRWRKRLFEPDHPEPWIAHWRDGRLGRIVSRMRAKDGA